MGGQRASKSTIPPLALPLDRGGVVGSGVTGGGGGVAGGRVPPETSDWEISAYLWGKKGKEKSKK